MMNHTQIPFLAEFILMTVALIYGILLHRKGKPYGKVKLVVHIFFYVWLTVGYCFITYELAGTNVVNALWIPVVVIGLMIVAQLVTGILAIVFRKVGKVLPNIHLATAIVMILSDICAFIIAGLRP